MVLKIISQKKNVEGIKYVINYDYPNSSEDYIHRIGRTARSDSTGTSYAFFTQSNSRQARDLIAVLSEANQVINPKLTEMGNRGGGYGKGGGGFGRGGGGYSRWGGGGSDRGGRGGSRFGSSSRGGRDSDSGSRGGGFGSRMGGSRGGGSSSSYRGFGDGGSRPNTRFSGGRGGGRQTNGFEN